MQKLRLARLITCCLLLGGGSWQMAQTAEAQQTADVCRGVVMDDSGEPLTGATIHVDGTNIYTAADIDGQFTLSNVKKGSKLLITFVGMSPVQVTWKGEPLTITMTNDNTVLEEVVVMGYGVEQKRTKVTNSIAKVNSEVLTVGTNANPAQALAGAVSGLKVSVTSGDPAATPNITIRGGTNWDGAQNNPLIVVDGQIRGDMSDINPNDIESMDVLKDAGATALYGARAANGVILITTKHGKQGTGRVTASVKYGITNYSSGYEFLNATDYINWVRTATYRTTAPEFQLSQGGDGTGWLPNFYANLTNGSQPYSTGGTSISDTSPWNILTLTDDNKYLLNHGWQTMPDPLNGVLGTNTTILYKDTDPLSHNMRENTATQDYNLTFSGGNDRGNYYASLGYYSADGALPQQYYKRYNFALTGGYKISSWLQSNSMLSFTRSEQRDQSNIGIGTGQVFGRVAVLPPTVRLMNEDGDQLYAMGLGGSSVNLWFQPERFEGQAYSNGSGYTTYNKYQMTEELTATIIPGLTLKGSMSWFYNYGEGNYFYRDYYTSAAGAMSKGRNTGQGRMKDFRQTYNLVANFNRTFADAHTINVMLGLEYYNRKLTTLSASGSGAPTDDFGNLQYTSSDAGMRSMYNYNYEEKIMSYFGRAEYDYKDTYLVAVTFREDGYSRLQNNRYGFFPGISAGWVWTQEDFWGNNSEWMNYGKLRASYGLNGIVNPNTITWYGLLGSYNSYQYDGQYGYRIGDLPNLDLRWEKTRTFDIGIDLGFWNNRLNVIATYFNRLTSDKYASKALPSTTGFSSVTTNNGSYRNQGIELEVSGTIVNVKGFQWRMGANITYLKNQVVDLPYNGQPRNQQGATQVYNPNWKQGMDENDKYMWVGGLQEGQEPMQMIGFKSAKILRSQADVEALGDYIDVSRYALASVPIYANESGYKRLQEMGLADNAVKLSPGDAVWVDVNGDNMIDLYDRMVIGHKIPHWTGGFNTTFSWNGLQLYARFDMGFDFQVYDPSYSWWMGQGQGTYNTLTKVKDTWTTENPNAKLPRYVIAANMGTDSWFRPSDFNTKTGNYLACREISLSYEFPKKILDKFKCQGLTLSVTGQNLGYLKKTTVPLPDIQSDFSASGSDRLGTYNLPKSVIFGLNISF